MSTQATPQRTDETDLRSRCVGVTPLTARLEPWHHAFLDDPDRVTAAMAEHGSPLNVLDTDAMERNARELQGAAAAHGVDLRIFFARKANKALAFVDRARSLGLGVDVAGERELRQTLDAGLPPRDVVLTAAVKPTTLLRLAVRAGVTIVVDNADELAALRAVADAEDAREVSIAVRLAADLGPDRRATRFGVAPDEALALLGEHPAGRLRLDGIHFHLDGYAPADRVIAIGQALGLVDALRAAGHRPGFLDIGGGIPMRYLDDADEWATFWAEQRRAVLGDRDPLTFDGHGLGLMAHDGQVLGAPNGYPYHQELIRGPWIDAVLGARLPGRPSGSGGGPDDGGDGSAEDGSAGGTVAAALLRRSLELRCEPGRSLLDGCGATVARVAFRKPRRDGTWLIGLEMNRTQCRTTSDDFLVDPLLLRTPAAGGDGGSGGDAPGAGVPGDDGSGSDGGPDGAPDPGADAIEGYLVGAYCIERELLTWRRLRFPAGVRVGDVVAFPNTAGYLMHILESASHQIPLARNVVRRPDGTLAIDAIDG
jgi:diaminopimelate decarboxylase